MNSADIIRRLHAEGWVEAYANGSHPKRDLPVGTVRNIHRQAGWPWK